MNEPLAVPAVKHWLTIVDRGDVNGPATQYDYHETEEAARMFASEMHINSGPAIPVLIYRFVTRATAKIVTEFDGGRG